MCTQVVKFFNVFYFFIRCFQMMLIAMLGLLKKYQFLTYSLILSGVISSNVILCLLFWFHSTGVDDYRFSSIYDQPYLISATFHGLYFSTLTFKRRLISHMYSLPQLYVYISESYFISETFSIHSFFKSSSFRVILDIFQYFSYLVRSICLYIISLFSIHLVY